MAKLTIGRMANLYGLHRSTLHEAVAKGRVTAVMDGKGQKVIDLAEMIRVYGEPAGKPPHHPTPASDTFPTLPTDAIQALLEELRLLREEVNALRKSMLLLEHKPDSEPMPSKSTAKRKPQGPTTWSSLINTLED